MRQKERMNNLFRTDVKEFVGTLNKEQEHELGSAKKISVPGNNISYTLIMSGVFRSQGSYPYFR
jgi:hypothetical protein